MWVSIASTGLVSPYFGGIKQKHGSGLLVLNDPVCASCCPVCDPSKDELIVSARTDVDPDHLHPGRSLIQRNEHTNPVPSSPEILPSLLGQNVQRYGTHA